MKYVVVDTKTGGFDANTHSLLSIALITTTMRWQKIDDLHIRIKHPVFNVTVDSLVKNNIDLRDATDWVEPSLVKTKILEFLGVDENTEKAEYKIFGTNVAFDIMFLKQFLGAPLYDKIFFHRFEEVTATFRDLQKTGAVPEPQGYTLEHMLSALGLKPDKNRANDALHDAEMAMSMAREMQNRVDLLHDALSHYVKRHGNSIEDLVSIYREPQGKRKLGLKKLRHANVGST